MANVEREDGEPARKRARTSEEAQHFFQLPSASARYDATNFEQPSHLTSFSYGPNRELLLPSSGRNDEALRLYADPKLGIDLGRGQNEAVMRKEGVAEGLDALLDTCISFLSTTNGAQVAIRLSDLPQDANMDSLLLRASVITWRGMLTRLLKAVFSSGANDSWEMNASMLEDTLYLEEHVDNASQAQRRVMSPVQKQSSYFGYAFEAYATCEEGKERSADGWSGPVNTNIQWCSIVKGKLGSVRMIYGGEVDCLLRPSSADHEPSNFVELKTNMTITSPNQEISFEKYKLLSMWLQSFLLGVRNIVVGFRSREGQLTAFQTFQTLEIPRLVRSKAHGWDPAAALAVGHDLLCWIRDRLAKDEAVKEANARFRAAKDSSEVDTIDLPVFRVRLDGSSRQLSLKRLSQGELWPLQQEADRPQRSRKGFLPSEWVAEAKTRRLRADPAYSLSPCKATTNGSAH